MEKIEIEVNKEFSTQFEAAVSACDAKGHKMRIAKTIPEGSNIVYTVEAYKEESFYYLGYRVGCLKRILK